MDAPKTKKAVKIVDPRVEFLKEKPKARISKGAAKAILGVKSADVLTALWVENYIDNLVRGTGLPPQLVSNDFLALLSKFCDESKASEILKGIRSAFLARTEPEETLAWLLPTLLSDRAVVENLPEAYLE